MKKQLLKKMAKAASVALVAGAMVCGTGLVANTNASAQGDPYLSLKQNNNVAKLSAKKADYVMNQKSRKATQKAYAKVFDHKSSRKGNKAANYEEKGIKAGKYNSHKLGVVNKNTKKVRKHVAKKNVKRNAKKVNHRVARRNAVRRANLAKREARQSLRRRAVKPMNRRAYRAHLRAVKNFRHSRYYHEVWSGAEKTNKRAVRLDQKRLNKTVNANNSKHLTKYEHRALNRSIKAQQHHINYMNRYVRHDAYMLSLAD